MSVFAFRWYSAQTLKQAVPRSAQSWVLPRVLVPDAGGFCSLVTKAEIFSAEHSRGLSCAQGFIFWFSNLILLFFWSDYQVPWWFIFQTLLCFDLSYAHSCIYFSDPFVLWSFWCSFMYLLPCLPLWVVFSIYINPTLFSYVGMLWFSISIILWTSFSFWCSFWYTA